MVLLSGTPLVTARAALCTQNPLKSALPCVPSPGPLSGFETTDEDGPQEHRRNWWVQGEVGGPCV